MSEAFIFILSFFTGIVLGIIFFAGLWWTLRKLVAPKASPFWMGGSWLLRMSITLYGFYAVTDLFPGKNGLFYLLVALLGFIVARSGVNRWVQREGSHASKS